MPVLQPPPYQDKQGTTRWSEWFRLINRVLQNISISIDGIDDVVITSVADEELLQYDSGTGVWVNQTLTEAGVSAIEHDHLAAEITDLTIEDNSDVTLTSLADEEILQSLSGVWINQTLSEAGVSATEHSHVAAEVTDLTIEDNSDVTLTTLGDEELLVSASGVWINQTLSEAGVAAAEHSHVVAEVTDYVTDLEANAAEHAGVAAADTLTLTGVVTTGSVDAETSFLLAGTDIDTLYAETAHTHVNHIAHTWAISGEVKVPSGDTDFIMPMFVNFATGQTMQIVGCRYELNSGTSATVKLQVNGGDATGFTGISVTTTAASTTPTAVSLSSNDAIALVVTAVAGTPTNMSFTMFLEQTQ